MELDIFKQPKCPHLHNGCCTHALSLINIEIPVTPIVCNISCKTAWNGPYEGRQISKEQERSWVRSMVKYSTKNSAEKITKYQNVDVILPDKNLIDTVKAAYMISPLIKSVGLSGSILFGIPKKDIDVILIVDDYKAFSQVRGILQFPTELDGLKVDMFTKLQSSLHKTFFAILDLSNLYLYISNIYKLRNVDPSITIINSDISNYSKSISYQIIISGTQDIDGIYNVEEVPNSNTFTSGHWVFKQNYGLPWVGIVCDETDLKYTLVKTTNDGVFDGNYRFTGSTGFASITAL